MIQFQAPVVQRVDNAIQRINSYPLGNAICFVNTYPLDSELSVGLRYPPFEQLGPDKKTDKFAMQLSTSIKKNKSFCIPVYQLYRSFEIFCRMILEGEARINYHAHKSSTNYLIVVI